MMDSVTREKGFLINRGDLLLEAVNSVIKAGATLVITYFAQEIAELKNKGMIKDKTIEVYDSVRPEITNPQDSEKRSSNLKIL